MKVDFLDLRRVNSAYGDSLAEAVRRVVRGGWYLRGEETAAFEREWADYVGVAHCVGCGNGLDALTLVLRSWRDLYGWREGDEVIVPANTFIATVLAISRAGLAPVFCDVREDTGLIDLVCMEQALSARTRCVLPVHLYGHLCDMRGVTLFARQHGLFVLEDACQAHGAASCGVKAGAWGHAAAFSFYPGKNLGAMGDGGCLVTNDEALARHARTLANYGETERYHSDFRGLNSRMDELQAAVLRVKLRRLDADNELRRDIARAYLSGLPQEVIPVGMKEVDAGWVCHLFPIRVTNRDRVRERLTQEGVMAQVHYPIPPHKQLAYKAFNELTFPHSEAWAREELSLPISPVMTREETAYVIETVNHVVAEQCPHR